MSSPNGDLTTTVAAATPSILFLAFLAVSWKPFTLYFTAVRRALDKHERDKPMIARVKALNATALRQRNALMHTADESSRQAARQALENTVAELNDLLSVLSPALNETSMAIEEAAVLHDRIPYRRAAAWVKRSAQRYVVSGLTAFAVVLAGARGARLRDTWQADLAGAPEEGLTMGRWQQVGHAMGFVVAAVRMRSHALAAPLWAPVDWLLVTESRTRTLITLTVGGQAIYIQKTDGLYTLLTEGWGWCGGCAVTLHFLFQWLRKVRGVELAVASDDTQDR
jgi:hypothetical protein